MNPTRMVSLLCSGLAAVCLGGCASTGGVARSKKVDLLFVQNAAGVTATSNTLTLRGVNPTTICFSDRPDRLAGHISTSKFVPMWGEGRDSFLKNPPNATLSVFRGDKVQSAVVTISRPRLSGGNLTYDIKVLEGSVPKSGGACSLFIDVWGMPLTPYSYAGAARRAWRRDAYYGTPAVYAAPAPYYPTMVHYGYAGGYGGYRTSAGGYGYWGGGSGDIHGAYGGSAEWGHGSGSIDGRYGGSAEWNDGSGSAQGRYGGSAEWSHGSGSYEGPRGGSASWHR